VGIPHVSEGKVTARQFREEHPDGFVFAFVRNPFSRLLSAYLYMLKQRPYVHQSVVEDGKKYAAPYAGFRDFVLRGVGSGHVLEQVHCKPQVSWISWSDGRVLTDFLGKYEALQADFDEVCRRLGWPFRKLPVTNWTLHKAYREYYDGEMARTVAKAYERDFEVGGYGTEL